MTAAFLHRRLAAPDAETAGSKPRSKNSLPFYCSAIAEAARVADAIRPILAGGAHERPSRQSPHPGAQRRHAAGELGALVDLELAGRPRRAASRAASIPSRIMKTSKCGPRQPVLPGPLGRRAQRLPPQQDHRLHALSCLSARRIHLPILRPEIDGQGSDFRSRRAPLQRRPDRLGQYRGLLPEDNLIKADMTAKQAGLKLRTQAFRAHALPARHDRAGACRKPTANCTRPGTIFCIGIPNWSAEPGASLLAEARAGEWRFPCRNGLTAPRRANNPTVRRFSSAQPAGG